MLGGCCQAEICLPNASQACSVGFISGDIAGQSIRWISSLSRQYVVHQLSSIWTSIIAHKNEVWTNCTSEKSHMWFQYLLSVPLGIHSTTVKVVQICTSTEHYACPHEYTTTTTKLAVFHNVCGMKLGSTFSPDYCVMGITVQTESKLICKQHVPPFIQGPMLTLLTPL